MAGGSRVKTRAPGRTRALEPGAPDDKVQEVVADDMIDFTIEELREFLEADHLEVPADPAFKEGLRRALWRAVLADDDEPAP